MIAFSIYDSTNFNNIVKYDIKDKVLIDNQHSIFII